VVPSPHGPTATSDAGGLPELLAGFAENLSARAGGGGQGDTYQRDGEINQVLQALASPLKGRVAVIGPARAGKTAVVHAVTARIASGDCPPELRGKTVWALTPASLPGLSARGNWRALLDQLFNRWAQHPEIILYIDEIARAARLPGGGDEDEGNSVDVATVIGTALKRLLGQCLVEAEDNAWRRFSEGYPDYRQIFLPVRVEAFDLPTTREVVKRVAEDLSILHGVAVSDDAIEQALDLSQRYALERAQPGKTIDILRDSLAVARAAALTGGEQRLTAENVVRRFGEQSGLPRMLLDDSVPFDEEAVLRFFKQQVLGQDQAVDTIVQSVSLLRARVHNPARPMGVFLFLGPTGVGKTELARTLAQYLYGNRDRLVRFNMADYDHPRNAIELFGSPWVTEVSGRRGQLTNRLAGRIFSVIVLDEFEKAAPNIYQRFLQLFDEGLLINGNDELVNLRNAIFILTSNFGARLIEHGRIGFAVTETVEAREKRVLSETEAYFTPEFMNRMDAVCIFHPLNRAVMADIARREIGGLLQRDGIIRRRFEVDIDDEVISHVVALGYSPHYGARYLKRQIEKIITYPLAREINSRAAAPAGGSIRLYIKHGRVTSTFLPPASALPARGGAGESVPAPVSLEEMTAALPILAARVEALEEFHGVAAAAVERDAILASMAEVSFWDDSAAARRKLESFQQASGTVDVVSSLRQALDRLAYGSNRPVPSLDEMARAYKFLLGELPRLEFTSWLSGPYDGAGAYLEISARGKQSATRRWAAELARMYLGWARQRRLTATVLGEDTSPEGRLMTLVLAISGFGVYGLLAGETGTHRLVQLVKVDGKESLERLTAAVTVWPELADDALPSTADLEVKAREINRGGLLLSRLTSQVTVRQTGTDRHFGLAGNLPPDDLAVEATRILRTKLHLQAGPPATLAAPGELVRSYHKNAKERGVVDHRTGWRSQKVKQVLEGDIQAALDANLKQRSAAKE
jgi:ATP-dependent Clp protease ATP-binding subunit ClpC